VGRGGKRGKTSGRGTKGQLARAGRKLRPELRDIIKKLPKLRGYRFAGVPQPLAIVKLGNVAKAFTAGAVVTPALLLQQGLIRRQGGVVPAVKLLSGGAYALALQFQGITASATAKAQIEKAGGTLA
jgi:large subunit ribosomal protein L15